MSRKLCGHMILMIMRRLMIMCRKHCIDMLHRKRINHEGNVAKVRLHLPDASHIRHLVTYLHLTVAMRALPVSCPEVNRDVRIARGLDPDARASEPPHAYISFRNRGLDPDARASEPPHAYISFRNLGSLNFLIEPGTPFRESRHDPFVARHFRNFAHKPILLFLLRMFRDCFRR